MLSLAQIEKIRKYDPYLYEALKGIVLAINSSAKQSGYDPAGIFPTTPNITACNVTSAAGGINVQILDNSLVSAPANTRTINYFVEIATDAGFQNVIHSEHMGPFRNKVIAITGQTVFVRAYSQLDGSKPSSPVAFGGITPTAVVVGGAAAPVNQTYQGSGNSSVSGQGYGSPVRSNPKLSQ